ncbi:uncharacterized protein LOC108317441 isoform X1 [Cebus imitator]|uniref:uncharacterized protein LOC108317441 isoform X1 n=1 Tax=Cebus imitator TaxID=2715852 RepID=UPI001899592A|nr:uncharacterized protein LOC108317441 isoform X1 [Cebus imitator]
MKLTFKRKAVSFADAAAAARSPLLPAMVNPTMFFNIAVDDEHLGCVSFKAPSCCPASSTPRCLDRHSGFPSQQKTKGPERSKNTHHSAGNNFPTYCLEHTAFPKRLLPPATEE